MHTSRNNEHTFSISIPRETNFGGMSETSNAMLEDIEVDINEVRKVMESLDVTKSPGLHGISMLIMGK